MIDNRTAAVANFNAIKTQIRQQAQSGADTVKQDGEKFEVVDSFQFSLPDGNYTVRKGSAFDDDPKTRDQVSVSLSSDDGVKENRHFEHYSKKKFIFFNDERLTVNVEKSQQMVGGFFSYNSSRDFSI